MATEQTPDPPASASPRSCCHPASPLPLPALFPKQPLAPGPPASACPQGSLPPTGSSTLATRPPQLLARSHLRPKRNPDGPLPPPAHSSRSPTATIRPRKPTSPGPSLPPPTYNNRRLPMQPSSTPACRCRHLLAATARPLPLRSTKNQSPQTHRCRLP